MTDTTFPFTEADDALVSEETRANVLTMSQELWYLRRQLADDTGAQGARAAAQAERQEVLLSALREARLEITEYEAILAAVQRWLDENGAGTIISTVDVEQLQSYIGAVSNAPLLDHDAEVRRLALVEAGHVVLATVNDDVQAGEPLQAAAYEQAIADAATRLTVIAGA